MFSRTIATSLLALQLGLTSAYAVLPTVTTPAPTAKPTMSQMLPAAPGSAIFVNVKRIFALYGDLIQNAPQYAEVKKAIEQGLPDPAKDIDEVGVSLDILKASSARSGGGVVTGRLDKTKLLALAAAHNITITPSMYRGIALITGKQADSDESVQLGLVDDETTTISIDKGSDHEATKAILATIKGETESFAQSSGAALPADYLAQASVQIPQEVINEFGSNVPPQFEVVTHIKLITLSINAQDNGDGSARLAATCDTEANAQALGALLEQLKTAFASSGSRGTDVLNRLTVKVEGKTATLELAIARAELEEIVAQ